MTANSANSANPIAPLVTEFLLLPDGRILVQNLTPVMAAILLELNPDETAIRRRVMKQSNPAKYDEL
ncbi:MAG TPA: hypothetical protein VFC44_02990 [Candidatus Saccharimonadales bacterium]|nr:hypothetical protein [Candidatus Saccharimonadales bacterium]